MRRLRAACALSLLLSAGAALAESALSPSPAPAASVKPGNIAKSSADDSDARWNELNPQQKQILEPFSSAWDKMDAVSRQKWLKVAGRLSNATPEQLDRIHAHMQEWMKLTPEQRRIVRENHVRANKLDPARKSAAWQQYQNLPEEQKKKLAASVTPKKHVANLPPHGIAKPLIPPIKSAPKKAPEKPDAPAVPGQATPAPVAPQHP